MTQSFPRKFQVPPLTRPLRLDKFLLEKFPKTSRGWWREKLDAWIRVDGKRGRKGSMLRGGETVEALWDPQAPLQLLPHEGAEIRVLYEDRHLIAVDKPAGLPCHPLKAKETGTVANALAARYPELTRFQQKPLEGGLLHRLDNETSGVLLFCRSAESLKNFQELNRERGIQKYYLAWVHGHPPARGRIDLPIAHHPKNKRKMWIPPGKTGKAQAAETEYRRLKGNEARSLVLLRIRKGVRHQIRIHLAHLGHPIFGDALYGGKKLPADGGKKSSRHLLHARKVEFKHPYLKKKITITAPLPRDFRVLSISS